MSFSKIFGGAKIIPVATFNDPEQAVRIARKLAAEGMPAIEVTLRTQRGLDCIRAIASALPDVIVGAGTVLTPQQMDDAAKAGARFLVSPGSSRELIEAARSGHHAWLPGVATPSEAMRMRRRGLRSPEILSRRAVRRRRVSQGDRARAAGPEVLPDRRRRPIERGKLSRAAERVRGRRLVGGAEQCSRNAGLLVVSLDKNPYLFRYRGSARRLFTEQGRRALAGEFSRAARLGGDRDGSETDRPGCRRRRHSALNRGAAARRMRDDRDRVRERGRCRPHPAGCTATASP